MGFTCNTIFLQENLFTFLHHHYHSIQPLPMRSIRSSWVYTHYCRLQPWHRRRGSSKRGCRHRWSSNRRHVGVVQFGPDTPPHGWRRRNKSGQVQSFFSPCRSLLSKGNQWIGLPSVHHPLKHHGLYRKQWKDWMYVYHILANREFSFWLRAFALRSTVEDTRRRCSLLNPSKRLRMLS